LRLPFAQKYYLYETYLSDLKLGFAHKVIRFYVEGFKSMQIGKRLWLIILIKLFIMFAILKIFFFPDILKKKFENDNQRGDYVIEQLTKTR
jgi:hypothetical protein